MFVVLFAKQQTSSLTPAAYRRRDIKCFIQEKTIQDEQWGCWERG